MSGLYQYHVCWLKSAFSGDVWPRLIQILSFIVFPLTNSLRYLEPEKRLKGDSRWRSIFTKTVGLINLLLSYNFPICWDGNIIVISCGGKIWPSLCTSLQPSFFPHYERFFKTSSLFVFRKWISMSFLETRCMKEILFPWISENILISFKMHSDINLDRNQSVI